MDGIDEKEMGDIQERDSEDEEINQNDNVEENKLLEMGGNK